MLRMCAARKLVQIGIPLITQLLDQSYFRSVVAVYGVALHRAEELDTNLILQRCVLPRRQGHEERILLFRCRILEVRSEEFVAFLVYPGEAPYKVFFLFLDLLA